MIWSGLPFLVDLSQTTRTAVGASLRRPIQEREDRVLGL